MLKQFPKIIKSDPITQTVSLAWIESSTNSYSEQEALISGYIPITRPRIGHMLWGSKGQVLLSIVGSE